MGDQSLGEPEGASVNLQQESLVPWVSQHLESADIYSIHVESHESAGNFTWSALVLLCSMKGPHIAGGASKR